jgi:hypothetical protein
VFTDTDVLPGVVPLLKFSVSQLPPKVVVAAAV